MQENKDISLLSGYHTPAKARYFIEYTWVNIDELREAVVSMTEQGLPILTLAGGQNSLLAFDEYPGLVIHNNSHNFTLEGNMLRADSGYPIWELAEKLGEDHGINIWHRFRWLPGSIGGAVYGNAGCFGLEIGPYVTSIEVLGMTYGNIFTKTREELWFAYRWSECKNHPFWFILSVTCDLSQMIEKYPAPEEDPLAWRFRVQPEWLSCGSFFKNPSREQSAGSLIEWVGLKGHHIWGAFFSDKHANFLMSDGTAKWTDLVDLVDLAQKKVMDKFQISLEPEVRIIKI